MWTPRFARQLVQLLVYHPWVVGAILVGLVVLGFYLPLLPSDPAPADGSSFTLAAFRLGQPHNPYPVHTILGFLFTKLPWGTVAWRVNLLSATAGAAASALMYLLVYTVVQRRFEGLTGRIVVAHLAGVVGAFSLAFSLSFWQVAEKAEVYTLNALLLIGLLLLLLRWDETGRRGFLYAGALVYGLSFGLQYFNIAYFPALILFIALSRHRSSVTAIRPLSIATLFLLGGLLQFVYLLLRPLGPPPEITTLSAYWGFQFGYQFDLLFEGIGSFGGEGGVSRQQFLGIFGAFLTRDFLLPGVALAAVGAWEMWKRRPPWFGLFAGIFLLNRLALVPFLNDPATLLNLPDLFIPANAMVALFIGVSVAGVYDSLQSLRPSSAWVLTGLLSLPLAIFISGIYLAHEPAQAAARARAADSSVYSKALLRHVPPNSTVFAGWSFATPLWYYQKVEGLGPDVRVLALWPDEWADHIAAAPPDEVIYLTHQPQGVVQGLPAVNVLQHDWMTAYKVAREADYLLQETPAVQHPFSINVSNQITFLGYNLEPTVVTPGGSFEIQYFWRARVPMKRDYEIFVHFVDSQDQIVFQQDHLPVGGVYPTQQWSRGDVVRESYVTIVPKEVRPGSYRILIGMWDPVENARLRVFGVAQYKDAIVLDGVTVSPQGE